MKRVFVLIKPEGVITQRKFDFLASSERVALCRTKRGDFLIQPLVYKTIWEQFTL